MELVCTINVEMLRRAKDRGFCLCETRKAEDNNNVCPCGSFLQSGECKCGVYRDCEFKYQKNSL